MSSSTFRWANLPLEVLRAVLGRPDATLDDAAGELTALFGPVPRGDFVADTWPVLGDVWLVANDGPHAADAIVALRAAGLGDLTIDTTTAAGTSAYLASCPDSLRLRSIILQSVLVAGRPATDGTDDAGPAAEGDAAGGGGVIVIDAETLPATVIDPATADELREAVKATLSVVLGSGDEATGEIVFDADGDIPIRWGSAVVYVRVLDDNPVIRIFSPLARELQITDELRDAVNELNKNHLFITAFWADDVVLLTADLSAAPFVPKQLLNLLNVVAETADSLDDQLHQRFAGTADGRPDAAGYL
jgi:hypothetical protein